MGKVIDAFRGRRSLAVLLTAVAAGLVFSTGFGAGVEKAEARYPDAIRKTFVKGCKKTGPATLGSKRLNKVCKGAFKCIEQKVSLNQFLNYSLALREGRKGNAEVLRKMNRCLTRALYKELNAGKV